MRSTAASRATAATSSRASASSEETDLDSEKERSRIVSSAGSRCATPEDPLAAASESGARETSPR